MLVLNVHAERSPYLPEEAKVVSMAAAREALSMMSAWPGYAPTPLRMLSHEADKLQLAEVLYKDESGRFGLDSFKALGGAYAAERLIKRALDEGFGARPLRLCCATDGNHGRSVAYAAKTHGLGCTVYMHKDAPPEKAAAIAVLGAEIVWVDGSYDDSVRAARDAAAAEGWLLVADTTEDPEDETPAHVMQGYGVMALELIEQWADVPPTHIFLQGGVGGLAAGIAGPMAERYVAGRPRVVVVEPEAAACLQESARQGRAAHVGGDLRTSMAMLSCGEASALAWTVLHRRADAFVTVPDEAAEDAAADLAAADPPISAGVSGAAGLAGLRACAEDPEVRAQLGLDEGASVLVIGTEGA